ncbi:thiamine biosynthesis protein ThiH [Anaerobacillus arseniciselenatis]|uniref:Thiamine biosynthesis protein ThiH n=1 Tax=Anaerobacillus arseniciselenatis TaxID=85682 RepID=A0A1S2LUL6_9BACI|nr:2-iminoacetate synthase ThiH [Anaerobacillus arseniciselenatis]OIJ16218.1 thiamine biosynthesis protein ThiH [Anaerobacillus arseniciselenatis]
MSFYYEYEKLKELPLDQYFQDFTEADVKRALSKRRLDSDDLLALLSPAAENFLEEMAQRSHELTVQHFGKTIMLFNPIYIADHCVNLCTYCSFSVTNQFERKKLSMEEIEVEAKALSEKGLKHILILTGESKVHTPVAYIADAVRVLKKYFPSVAIEINPLDTDEYKQLVDAGIDGLTVYQEVYNEDMYKSIHVKGPKRDYRYRMDTPERGCEAGIRQVNIGALLGLENWRKEAYFTAMHAKYLQSKYLDAEISLSLPRMRPHIGEFQPPEIVEDRHLVQAITAFRLFLPRSGITLSTREPQELRDNLIYLGVTKMSAGASTEVGGYSQCDTGQAQFDISDERSLEEIQKMIKEKGYQPVLKDWELLV